MGLGSALIRLVNSQQAEYEKFLAANTEAKSVSLSILKLFASLVPAVTFFTNMATLVILIAGGHCKDEISTSIVDAISVQRFALEFATKSGFNPDAPKGLSKVTLTH